MFQTGLFHKAVSMAGYINVPSEIHRETNEGHAREVAKSLGYDGNLHDLKKLLSFLKKQEPTALIAESRRVQKAFQEVMI